MQSLADLRRETAEKEIGSTLVNRKVCVASIFILSVVLVSVPICQFTSKIIRGESFQIFRVVELLSEPKREVIEKFEDRLEEESVLTNWLMPHVQTILTGLLHIGNEQAYLGQDGWLFYRADIDSLYIYNNTLSQVQLETSYPQAALKTITDFKKQLKDRNITLIVMPIPVKPSIHPEKFSVRHQNPNAPIHNHAYTEFIEQLVSNGVLVYDPSSILFEASQQKAQYLKTDTHWKPEAMERIAKHLAEFITDRVKFVNTPTPIYTETATDVVNVGDITNMLNLSAHQTLFPPENVTIHIVHTQDSQRWKPNQNSEILFLGDSFSNIYSLDGMGWGESAGLVEHLSAKLERPIDKITINAGGALATRQALAQQPDRLIGKRVLLYQFASRELYSSNWTPIQIQHSQSKPENEIIPTTQLNKAVTISASIKDKTDPPTPGSVPYSDCIIALHLENINVPDLPEELVVFIWGMRKNRWTAAATYKIGQNVTLRIRNWDSVQADYGSYNRKELDNEGTWLLDVYWGEKP